MWAGSIRQKYKNSNFKYKILLQNKMKKLIIFATTNKNFISINLIKTIINSKLFKIEAIILKKNSQKKFIFLKKIKL